MYIYIYVCIYIHTHIVITRSAHCFNGYIYILRPSPHSVCRGSLMATYIMLLAWHVEHSGSLVPAMCNDIMCPSA